MTDSGDLASELAGHVRIPDAARMTGLSTRELYERIDRVELAAVRDRRGMVVVALEALAKLET